MSASTLHGMSPDAAYHRAPRQTAKGRAAALRAQRAATVPPPAASSGLRFGVLGRSQAGRETDTRFNPVSGLFGEPVRASRPTHYTLRMDVRDNGLQTGRGRVYITRREWRQMSSHSDTRTERARTRLAD